MSTGAPPPPPYAGPPSPPPVWVVVPGDGWAAPKGFTPDGRALAGIGRRLGGLVVDGLLILVPPLLVTAIALGVAAATLGSDGSPSTAGEVALVLAYVSLFAMIFLRVPFEALWVRRHGATLGMGWLGLAAVDARNGGPVSRGSSWVRAVIAAAASGQVAGLGFWWALFDARRRTLHDLVANTVVVDARSPGRAATGAARWPPRWVLPVIVAMAVMSTLGVAAGGTSLVVAHLNVRGPIDATTAFLRALDVGSQDRAVALSCQEGGGYDEPEARIQELRLLLEEERWDGEAHLLGTDLGPFDLSADTATVTGALSVHSLTGASRDFRGTIVDLSKEQGRWKVCDIRIV